MGKVDYEHLAPTYDERYRAGALPELCAFVRMRCREVGGGAVLEVGCGTGRWLLEASPFASRLAGVDASAAMLARARGRLASASLVQARAESLPIASERFALILCINAVHHFDDGARFVREAWRVLVPGGMIAVVALAPHDGCDRWYLYDYFNGTQERDLARYPPTERIASWMAEAGFADPRTEVAARLRGERRGAAVFGDPLLGRLASSQLALLDDAAFARGLDGIKASAAADATFVTDMRLFGTTARKP